MRSEPQMKRYLRSCTRACDPYLSGCEVGSKAADSCAQLIVGGPAVSLCGHRDPSPHERCRAAGETKFHLFLYTVSRNLRKSISAEGRLEEMESGLAGMLAEIVSMEERKQALLEELNELDQRLFKAKSKWVRCQP